MSRSSQPRGRSARASNPVLVGLVGLVGLSSLALAACGGEPPPPPAAACPEAPAAEEVAEEGALPSPPDYDAIPEGPFGDAVRRGEQIFRDTQTYAADYVGTAHNCDNCHLDGGRRPSSAPMWAAWGMYPDYRKKNDRINSMEDRLRGCFTYSMNASASKAGAAPPPGDPVLQDLQAYMRWMAAEMPVGHEMPGRGYPALDRPEPAPSASAGALVYKEKCALCHGDDGQGGALKGGEMLFPPLWGENAYNWGAGMHRVNTAAGFIQANMPLGKGGSLSDREAWDVAAYINSHERPQDPRQEGTVAEADVAFHEHDCMYGDSPADGGATLGAGTGQSAE